MVAAADPVQQPADDGAAIAAGGMVDAALHAARVAAAANERQRLVRFVCRHLDLAELAGNTGLSPSAGDFTMVLQDLARD